MGDGASYETTTHECCTRGDYAGAATILIRGYGPEIVRFLYARLRDEDLASEAFSQFTEDLWRGLAGFEWRCSARVWAYAVARHAASRTVSAARRGRRHVALSEAAELSQLEHKVRTETLAFLRSEAKGRIERLRAELPEEDQALLLLRINRQLSWKDIALVFLYDGRAIADADLQQEAARLRKRFQLLKEKLRRISLNEGSIED